LPPLRTRTLQATPTFTPLHNDLLDAVLPAERLGLGIGGDTVILVPGQVLHQPGRPITHL
jgi:hypothetical protein